MKVWLSNDFQEVGFVAVHIATPVRMGRGANLRLFSTDSYLLCRDIAKKIFEKLPDQKKPLDLVKQDLRGVTVR